MRALEIDEAFMNQLESKHYRVHSVYEHAMNLSDGVHLLSVTTMSRALTPGGLRVNQRSLNNPSSLLGQEVFIKDSLMHISNLTIDLNEAKISSCVLTRREKVLNWDFVSQNMNHLIRWLDLNEKKTASMAMYCQMVEPFDVMNQAVYQRLHQVKEDISNDILDVSQIFGAGYGLTPTGDDVICGMLAVYHYLNFKEKVNQIEEQVSRFGRKRTTDVSWFMLKYAFDGRFAQIHQQMVETLFEESLNEAVVEACAEVGHSSGIDFMIGVILALNDLIRQCEGEKHGKKNSYF